MSYTVTDPIYLRLVTIQIGVVGTKFNYSYDLFNLSFFPMYTTKRGLKTYIFCNC